MNTEPKVPTKHLVDRQANYCETVKIIKDVTKIEKLFSDKQIIYTYFLISVLVNIYLFYCNSPA